MPAACMDVPVAKKSDRIDLRCSPELRRRLERQCARFNVALTAYITQAVVQRLEADEATDPQAEVPAPEADDAAPKPKPRRKSD